MTHRLSFLLAFTFACGGSDVSLGNDDSGGDSGSADAANGNDGSVLDAPSGTDAPSEATLNDSSTFDPSSVSGLVLWLEASSGVTQVSGAVSVWADKTTNKNDAKQSSAALQPTLVASVINGLPAIHFNKDAQGVSVGGNMLTIADAASLQWGTGDFYIIIATRFDNTVADGPERGVGDFYAKPGTGGNFPGVFVTTNIPGGLTGGAAANGMTFSTSFASGNYVTTTSTYNNNTPHALAVQRSGATLDLRIDGVSKGTATSSNVDVSSPGVVVSIGGEANGAGLRFDGDIAEMLAVKGTLTTADRSALEQYLKTKYGL